MAAVKERFTGACEDLARSYAHEAVEVGRAYGLDEGRARSIWAEIAMEAMEDAASLEEYARELESCMEYFEGVTIERDW